MAVLTLHIPWHAPLFSIRSSESQGFSLDFGQHVSAAGPSWRLRTARRDTWTRGPRVPTHASNQVHPDPQFTVCFSLSVCLSSNYRSEHDAWFKRPGWHEPASVCSGPTSLIQVVIFAFVPKKEKKKKKRKKEDKTAIIKPRTQARASFDSLQLRADLVSCIKRGARTLSGVRDGGKFPFSSPKSLF